MSSSHSLALCLGLVVTTNLGAQVTMFDINTFCSATTSVGSDNGESSASFSGSTVTGCFLSASATAFVNSNSISGSASASKTGCATDQGFFASASGSATFSASWSSPTPVAGQLLGSTTGGGTDLFGNPIPLQTESISVVLDTIGFRNSGVAFASVVATSLSSSDSDSIGYSSTPDLLDTDFSPCGVTLGASADRQLIDTLFQFRASETPVTPHGFFVFGFTPLAVVIPPLGCTLGQSIDLAVPAPVATDGTATLSFSASSFSGPVVAYVQYLSGTVEPDGLTTWRISNRVEIDMP